MHHWQYFMLADNDEDRIPHAGTALARVRPGSPRFAKRTYINLSAGSEYIIEYKHLQRWTTKSSSGPITFDQSSFEEMQRLCVGFEQCQPAVHGCV